ncbi:hypothetical protein E6H36_07315 [Candidatus Bathyarchaeota archaeon]|nr:MAG: hypothetical protein E6H36_07315 [Candidatus Bathyarchaeota archaeon]TMI31467.1 MAG: hypothetical protein E6H29_04470 [Candidatus Bathyarchaeota archaeon]
MAFGLDLTAGGIGLTITIFTIGLLLGVVVKRVFKLAMAIISLVVLLILTGYVNINPDQFSRQAIYRAYSLAPTIASTTSQVATLLPLTSTALLAGIAIGLWKG